MANELISSLSALGIALAPALLKFAEAAPGADVEVDDTAEVQCITENDAPIHGRYQSTGTAARLAEGDVVQVLSKRKNWRHVAYVEGENAELGWITTKYLGPCEPEPNPDEPDRPDVRTRGRRPDTSEVDRSPHVLLGVPTDADASDDILVNHGEFVLSYSKKRNNPNWVAWRLRAGDLGDEDRQNDFRPDEALPDGILRVTSADYSGTGFDQGHMCPSAHRTGTEDANSLTFLMTNMQPQVHGLNAGPWKSLETFERKLADEKDKELYIVAGGLFAASPRTIGRGVAVPKSNFRVTVILEKGQRLADVSAATPIHAVEMPNDTTAPGNKWHTFKLSVDDVEKHSGYDFLSALPDSLERQVEGVVSPAP